MTTARFVRRRALGLCAAAPALLLAPRARAGALTRISVLHTNDTHSRMEPFSTGQYKGRGGVARRATLIAKVRAQNPNVLLLDAGDTYQGTAWFNEFKGTIDAQVMDALGYDATAIGNHDFDAGVDKLAENLKLSPHLIPLSANFRVDDSCPLSERLRPHAIVERGPVRIGMFGLGVRFEGLVNPKLHAGVAYADPREAASEQVELLRERGCDVIIALSHLGYMGYRGEVGDVDWPKDVPGIHYVVGGHTHTFLTEPDVIAHKSGWRTSVMQVGHSGLNIGHAEFLVDSSGRTDVVSARPRGIGGRPVRA